MAQTGYTPIQLYNSSTASAAPTAGNLATGELAINTLDEKLYFKNSAGVVKVLASTAATGSVTSVAATVPSFLSVSGSPITSSGTLAFSYSGTALPVANGGTGLTSLTANYIPYGNGTSAFSSSANLQFDGTVMRVGSNAVLGGTTNPVIASTGSTNNYIQSYIYNATNGASSSADFVAYANNSTDAHGWSDLGFTSASYADATYTVTGPNEAYLFGSAPSGAGTSGNLVYATDNTGTTNAHQWYVGGFTQAKGAWKMQLTSSGLQLANALSVANGGTGLTAPGASGNVLQSNGTGFVSAPLSAASVAAAGSNTQVQYNSGGNFAGSDNFVFDGSNVGIGVVPSAWYSSAKAIQLGTTGTVFGRTGNELVGLASNAYNSGASSATYSYITSGNLASLYQQDTGIHKWFTAPSGTAGAAISFTQAMTLDASGNLVLGDTSTSYKLDVAKLTATSTEVAVRNTNGRLVLTQQASGGAITQYYKNATPTYVAGVGSAVPGGTAQSALIFSDYQGSWVERMRIDASGNVGIGTSSPGFKLEVSGTSAAGYVPQALTNLSTNGYVQQLFNIGATGANGQAAINYAPGIFFAMGPTGNDTTTPIVFRNNNGSERMRIDAVSGNVGIGTSSPTGKFHVNGGSGVFTGVASDTWAASTTQQGLVLNGSNVGVSTITSYLDETSLRIGAGTTQKTGIFINGQSASGGSYISATTGGSERMRIDASGNVGIGTSSPGQKLSVAGVIESTSGGVKFPDGTTQTTAAVGGGGMTLLATVTPANGVTSVNVTGLASSKQFVVIGEVGGTNGVTLSASSSVRIKLSVNNGSSFPGATISISSSNINPGALFANVYNTSINAQKRSATFVSGGTSFVSETDSTINAGVVNSIQITTDGSATFTGVGIFYIYGVN